MKVNFIKCSATIFSRGHQNERVLRKKMHTKKIYQDLEVSINEKFKIKIRCYEGRSKDCEENWKKGQWIRAGTVYLLILTDRSANEEWSDVRAAFVVRKIKNGQIWKSRSDDYIRKYMLFLSSRFSALKSDLEWLLQQKSQWRQ